MRVTVDTNILVRAVVDDDRKQAAAAARLLKDAEIIAIPLPCLCESVSSPRQVYSVSQKDICATLRLHLAARRRA
jgi:predicted nucleic-acid-binding protein